MEQAKALQITNTSVSRSSASEICRSAQLSIDWQPVQAILYVYIGYILVGQRAGMDSFPKASHIFCVC